MQRKLRQSEKWMSEDGVGTYNKGDFQRYKSSVKCTQKKKYKRALISVSGTSRAVWVLCF